MDNNDSLIIREAKIDDIPAIQSLYRQGDKYHAELLPDVFQETEEGRTKDFILSWIQNEKSDYFVAEMEGKIIGFMNIKQTTSQDIPILKRMEYALIDDFVVDVNHRFQGIGTALFKRAKLWSKEHELNKIQLTVWAKNEAARNFYFMLGFKDLIGKMEIDL
ncbi:MAG: GNAT family N-acetyltransferase [Methanomassiliicoccales archaeon]|nr:MAG: GNAT family N-acetyltransferase [Methanomassiliicoccales archaeon]